MRVLNVGGGSKSIQIPSHYSAWEHVLLDIDPRENPDLVCDARELNALAANQFEAIYCSHNLEHYYKHECYRVLRGFLHVLRNDGFAEVRVPDLGALMRHVVQKEMDIEEVLYMSPAGPITPRDVLYGYGLEIESSGQDFYAHKTGFTERSLLRMLEEAGFEETLLAGSLHSFELHVFAFKETLHPDQLAFVSAFALTKPEETASAFAVGARAEGAIDGAEHRAEP